MANAAMIIFIRLTFDIIFDMFRYFYLAVFSKDPVTTKKMTGSILTMIGFVYYPFIAVYSTYALNGEDA